MRSRKTIWAIIALVALLPCALFDGASGITLIIGASFCCFGMAVTASQLLSFKDDEQAGGPVAASTFLYASTACFINAAGFYDDDTATGVNKFAGFVKADADNSAGANGDIGVEVRRTGKFLVTTGTIAQTDVGEPLYASDNFTFTITRAVGAVFIGVIDEFVSTTSCWVEIDCDNPLPGAAIIDATDLATCITRITAIIDVMEERGDIISS